MNMIRIPQAGKGAVPEEEEVLTGSCGSGTEVKAPVRNFLLAMGFSNAIIISDKARYIAFIGPDE
ncbi:MAG: hypothetical protein KA369_14395 [Spirochaetes bacterium]|nr:hypothetical protein [Spirochaetota bacterium]